LQESDVNLHLENPDGQNYAYRPNHWQGNVTNPLYELWKSERQNEQTRFMGSYDLSYTIADWINFEASYAFEGRDYKSTSYDPFDSWVVGGSGQVYSEGYLRKYASKELAQTFRGTFNLSKIFNELILKAKLSYLYEDDRYESFEASGSDFTIKNMPTFDALKKEDITADSYMQDITAVNYFGIVSLLFKERYILDGLLRLDGSSLFGENERYHTYYRVSGAYRISQDSSLSLLF